MEQLTLVATRRTVLGKKVKRLRRDGRTPGMLYGHGQESQPIDLDTSDFLKVYRQVGGTALVTVAVDGKSIQVLIRKVAIEPIKRTPIHIDLYQVRMDEPITSSVPIVFEGSAPAVSQHGGVLLHPLSHVTVRCLPAHLPPSFHVDLSKLTEVDQALTVGDLPKIEGVEVLGDPHEIVAKVMPPRRPEEEEVAEEAPPVQETPSGQASAETETA
jgi:large subunit ribosomal protein L25